MRESTWNGRRVAGRDHITAPALRRRFERVGSLERRDERFIERIRGIVESATFRCHGRSHHAGPVERRGWQMEVDLVNVYMHEII